MTFNKAITLTADTTDSGEEPFAIEEVFYSRTDKRGVIRTGNAVFQRVSGYDWDRLVGAPHRIIRHPDMPRAVFWLMWQTIQQGKPLASYVKNRSASGRFYWVMALVVPYEDGYLSTRIKPSGPLFTQIQTIYAKVAEAERVQTLTPERSCELLLAHLNDLGFASYADFMAVALEQEISARSAAMGRSNASQSRFLAAVTANLKATQDKQKALLAEFDELQSIPTNMRIIASRLEPSGGPISAISDNYKFASTEISRRLEAFAGSENNLCTAMATIVSHALFLSSAARLLAEVPDQLAQDAQTRSGVEVNKEIDLFKAVDAEFRTALFSAVLQAEQVSGELNLASGEIRRMMLGLDTIRVMGRVESGRLGASGVGLSSTIDQLDMRHAAIAELLQGLMDLSASVKATINAYERQTADD